jgi:hypothetical protein
MTDNHMSHLDKYFCRTKEQKPPAEEEQDPVIDNWGFGWLRGMREVALCLEIRHRDGQISAFSYATMDRAEFDPSDGITLHFGSKTVKIVGRNLNVEARPNVRLFNGILRRRIPWIQVADEPTALKAPKDATVIERVDVK